MKVGGVGGGGKPISKAGKLKASESHKKVEATEKEGSLESLGAGAGDHVEVSDHAQTLDVIREMVSGSETVRTSEVERIVNDLKSGKFKINFEKVAEGFIREAILDEMSKRSRGKRDS